MLTCKGNLILQADVELLEEEVLPDRDLTANETTIKLDNKIDDQTREINCLYERNKTIERKLDVALASDLLKQTSLIAAD